MPVFARMRDGITVITVDGDYTSEELRRVGAEGLKLPGPGRRTPVFLDITGAAGLTKKRPEQLRETATFFADLGDSYTCVAILATEDLAFGLMRMAETFFSGEEGAPPVRVFRARQEAMEWLDHQREGEG